MAGFGRTLGNITSGGHMSDSTGEGGKTGSAGFHEVSQEEIEEIEAERKRRLDPANRPEMAEVDNTDRNFDLERGEFTDPPSEDGESGS
jgi:hypothetical protein